ncbi:MAG: Protein kinase [Pseudomonadota bacterium]|jgi:predicted Ser/Thr protein kinase
MGVSILDELSAIDEAAKQRFEAERRVLSFEEYLGLFGSEPGRYCRNAAEYLKDAFDHFGKKQVHQPWGETTRYQLFDLPWLDSEAASRDSLVGQESVQGELYRILSNFVRGGRPNKLPLLHGPNGSAKSTVARCLMMALEHYSKLDAGALYRFHWVFPSQRTTRGSIGFGEKTPVALGRGSFAHLSEEQIDARLIDEVRDHPLLLLPTEQRRPLLDRFWAEAGVEPRRNDWLWNGSLSQKNRTVFDALYSNYEGSLKQVLQHVQVERYFVSRRYRTGAVTIGPELSVDARERQVTADRSLGALPSSLQAVTLFEVHGELIDAAGGLLEFSDLLKRPLDAFKYLQLTVETGELALPSQNVQTNCVMIASANEVELTAFRKHHEFESFRGRVELIRTPYLRSYPQERQIYDAQITSQVRGHVVPHATEVAAMFAVLTRLIRPDAEHFPRPSRDVIRSLTAIEKMDLLGNGTIPGRLDNEKAKALRGLLPELYAEGESQNVYEGGMGASPREMRTVLMDAAQNSSYHGLSPFAVLEELDRLCAREGEYTWLKQEPIEGGYHDHLEFRRVIRERLLTTLEDEFRVASSLVDDARYGELFDRYVLHFTHWVKKEQMRNPITGEHEDPDERLMREVEGILAMPDNAESVRHTWMNRIAAWAIENPGQRVNNHAIFGAEIKRLRDAVFGERREALAKLTRDIVIVVREEGAGLSAEQKRSAEAAITRLGVDFGYERQSAADSVAMLVRHRYANLLT